MRVVVVDNASPDDSVARIQALGERMGQPIVDASPEHDDVPKGQFLLVRSSENLGFAGGVNLGLKTLMSDDDVELFWLLNPDCVVSPSAATEYAKRAAESQDWGLMGGRTLYHGTPPRVQSDGGQVSLWTGVCRNINAGVSLDDAEPPDIARVDYFAGANFVASRRYLDRVGLMPEVYFLFFEEVEWALRRGDLKLVSCPTAAAWHRSGTATGSAAHGRKSSAFSNYFNYRSRMMFIKRNNAAALPFAFVFSLVKIFKLVLERDFTGAHSAFLGLSGRAPPESVTSKLSLGTLNTILGAHTQSTRVSGARRD